jgi:uncharacterized protein involved in tolerance to divalent cations
VEQICVAMLLLYSSHYRRRSNVEKDVPSALMFKTKGSQQESQTFTSHIEEESEEHPVVNEGSNNDLPLIYI